MGRLSIEFKYIGANDKPVTDFIILENIKAKDIAEAFNTKWMNAHYKAEAFVNDLIHSFADNILSAGLPVDVVKVCYLAEGAAPMRSSGAKLSPAQEKFRAAFPDKKIDCEVPEGVDIDKVIKTVRERPWLQQSNISLKSCCINLYDQIKSPTGYAPFKAFPARDPRNDFMRREYTREELNDMFSSKEPYEVEFEV